MKLEQLEKKKKIDLFSQLKIFLVFFFRLSNVICPNWIQNSHSFIRKIAKFELSHQKKC